MASLNFTAVSINDKKRKKEIYNQFQNFVLSLEKIANIYSNNENWTKVPLSCYTHSVGYLFEKFSNSYFDLKFSGISAFLSVIIKCSRW